MNKENKYINSNNPIILVIESIKLENNIKDINEVIDKYEKISNSESNFETKMNQYISNIINYINKYIEHLNIYFFNKDKENNNNYIIIIHRIIESLFNIINRETLENQKIEKEHNLEEKYQKLNNILILINNIIKNSLKEEQKEQEQKLFIVFQQEIKKINKIYQDNKEIYNELVKAIEEDIEEEKQRRIEYNYIRKKNELECEYKETEGKIYGYLEIIKMINENELLSKDYNIEINKLINLEEYLKKKSNKYFNKEILHSSIKIVFKQECKKCIITYGEITEELNNVKIYSYYYLNPKNVLKNRINIETLIKGKKRNLNFYKKEISFYNIDKTYALQENEKLEYRFKSLIKEKSNDIEVTLIINNQLIDINHIKNDLNFKNLEMGLDGIKSQLNKGIDIINKNEFYLENCIPIIKQLIKNFETLKDLEFNNPKFDLGPPKKTIFYCEKYKNFKDMIIGELDFLIKYNDNLLKKNFGWKAKI